MTDDRLSTVRNLLTEGALEEAGTVLRTIIEGMTPADDVARGKIRDLNQDIIVQLGSIVMLNKSARRGVLSADEEERQRRRISFGLLDLVDDVERIAARADVVAAAEMPRATITAPPPVTTKLEKIWGRNNLQDLAWLERGVIASRAVCRVISPEGIGTGFMIDGKYVVTNNHVVSSIDSARETMLEFNFEQDLTGRLKQISTYMISANADHFATSPVDVLDCTIMRVQDMEGMPPLADWGTLPFAPPTAEIQVGDPVTIIQHPNGGQKKIAVTANEIVNVFDHRLHYMTDTLPGSSGSPVFNEKWQVIALHHAGGELAKNANGDRFFANEGILFHRISSDPAFARFFAPQ